MKESKDKLGSLIESIKLVSLTGKIKLLTGATFSYADLKEQTMTLLPLMLGSVYLPEGLMRGRWRHICVLMIKEALLARLGVKLTLNDLYWLYIGGVKDGGEMSYDVLADLPTLRAHVYSSFWGCSEPMFQERKVQVEDARPNEIVLPEIIYGQRTDPVQRGEVQKSDLENPASFDGYLDKLETIRTGRKAAQQAEKDRKSGKVPANNNVTVDPADPVPQPANMPHSRQIIPPNLELDHNIDIIRPTALQIGMFLATLRKWSENPYFGARVGRNMGLVDVTYDVVIDGRDMGQLKVHGRKRQIEMPEALVALEKLFWDQFDSLDFRKPIMRQKAVPTAPAVKPAVKVAAAAVRPAPTKRAAVKKLATAARRRHAA